MTPSAPHPVHLAEQRAALERLDQRIVSLLRERLAADAQIQLLRTEARLGTRTLTEENEILGRYSQALGRTGTRIALLLLAQAPEPVRGVPGHGIREPASPVSTPS